MGKVSDDNCWKKKKMRERVSEGRGREEGRGAKGRAEHERKGRKKPVEIISRSKPILPQGCYKYEVLKSKRQTTVSCRHVYLLLPNAIVLDSDVCEKSHKNKKLKSF